MPGAAQRAVPLETSLTAVGYVDVLRVPTSILEKSVFPKLAAPAKRFLDAAERPLAHDGLLEWLVSERFINGTQTMLIDLDRCTRCDDCVRACAATHEGNPRFIRQGQTFDHWMVANACMHCADPVCMIGCPTGAIHRSDAKAAPSSSTTTPASAAHVCELVPVRKHRHGQHPRRAGKVRCAIQQDREPILKATKCDLCSEQLGGPACVRACPHDALRRVDFRDFETVVGTQSTASGKARD